MKSGNTKPKFAAVISYCSYHNPFIKRCIAEALKVADEVVVVSYDKFFNGEADPDLMDFEHSKVRHYFFPYNPIENSRWHHNQARLNGYRSLKGRFKGVFFIDADEVLEGDKVKLWLKGVDLDQDYKLAHFWYYRDTCYRADQVEEGAVYVSTKTLESKDMNWWGWREREDFTKDWNYMAGYKNQVLGHHYSWAGTKEMIMRKVKSWGHNADGINWERLVEQEYSHKFNGSCPFKPYTFTEVKSYIGIKFNE